MPAPRNSNHYSAGLAPARRWLALAALFLLATPFASLEAQPEKPTQNEVEAVYLLTFARFVRWPQANGTQPVSICVMGDEAFVAVLDRTLGGEQINGQSVTGRRVLRPEEASDCSILYISSSQSAQTAKVLSLLQQRPVLTVSDMPGFLERGGIIQFVVIENHVRFEVNLEPTERDGLVLSSELLKVAVKVRDTKAQK